MNSKTVAKIVKKGKISLTKNKISSMNQIIKKKSTIKAKYNNQKKLIIRKKKTANNNPKHQ